MPRFTASSSSDSDDARWANSAQWGRPSKRGSRPRTKQRPAHQQAVTGFVTAVDRGRYTLLVGAVDASLPHPGQPSDTQPSDTQPSDIRPSDIRPSNTRPSNTRPSTASPADTPDAQATTAERTVVAMKARELHRDRVVVGDRVDVVGDTSGRAGSLARIVRIHERTSTLRRTADDTDPYERIVVANADQLVIVVALANPTPRTGMIDRCVVAAYDAGMDVVLCLTKADLASAQPLRELYEPAGVRVLVTKPAVAQQVDDADGAKPSDADGAKPSDADGGKPSDADGAKPSKAGGGKPFDAGGANVRGGQGTLLLDADSVEMVRGVLTGKISVTLGHSGVGKSTLVNALVPGVNRATGVVNDVTGRGRHTSTSAVALRLPTGPGAVTFDGWIVDTPGIRSLGLAHVTVDHVLAAFEDLHSVATDPNQGCPRGCSHMEGSPDCALDDWVHAGGTQALTTTRGARLASFRRLIASRATTVEP